MAQASQKGEKDPAAGLPLSGFIHAVESLQLYDSQDFASVPVVWTSHGKATDAYTISHAV